MPEAIATTLEQRKIMRHALGITQTRSRKPKVRESYRNNFFTGPGSSDYPVCRELERMGLMTCRRSPISPDFIFYVTEAGKREIEALV